MKKYQYHSPYTQEKIDFIPLDSVLIKRLFSYLKPYFPIISLAILFLLGAKMIEAFIPIRIGTLSQIILDNPQPSPLLDNIIAGCLSIIGFLLISYLLESVHVVLKTWIGQKALRKLRTDVFEKIQSLPIEYFDQHSIGRLMTRTIHDVDQINQLFSESVVPLLGSIFLFFFVSVGVFVVNWKLAAVFFTSVPFLFWIAYHFRNHQRKAYEKIRRITSAMNTFFHEHLEGAATIRHFGIWKRDKKTLDAINSDYCTAYLETSHHYARLFASLSIIQSITLISLFTLLALSTEGFQGGIFFTFSLYVIMIFRPISDLAERYNMLQSALAAAARVFYILDESPEHYNEKQTFPILEVETIEFQNIGFSYKPNQRVLKGISFVVKKGETIALVGMTGAGKTTITNLLLRYYDIQEGVIKINGRDIRDYSLHELRSAMAVVLQDPVIFSGTIRENVTLNEPTITDEMIDKAVDDANMRPFVRHFPESLDHRIAERGSGLSTGEKQLLSLARAVAHNRSILILDEATANIDAATERAIQEALDRILHNKTAIVIAHRLSTIQNADAILVIHRGEIRERGTHKALIAQGGIYEKLYRLQFLNNH